MTVDPKTRSKIVSTLLAGRQFVTLPGLIGIKGLFSRFKPLEPITILPRALALSAMLLGWGDPLPARSARCKTICAGMPAVAASKTAV